MTIATTYVPVVLPRGRATTIACGKADLSITAALVATRGDWEPHIRKFLERNVRPEWVCLDIGANIGIHTLSMSSLATAGQVIAFEADDQNFSWLSSNIRKLDEPKAAIRAVNCALWDTNGIVNLSSIDELSGCCFIAETDSLAENERRIREVVNPAAIQHTELHMRVTATHAFRLDDWVADSGLERIDLIKMDVEGAEIRVLRGADRTIRQFNPILVTECNPACGTSYFGYRASGYFDELQKTFGTIRILEQDGSASQPIGDWETLKSRLEGGRGWEDLLCMPRGIVQSGIMEAGTNVGR